MRKLKVYKGFIIATNKNNEYFVFTKDEYSYGNGYRNAEFECQSINECIENINSY